MPCAVPLSFASSFLPTLYKPAHHARHLHTRIFSSPHLPRHPAPSRIFTASASPAKPLTMPADATGPLATELAAFEQSFRSKSPPEMIKAIDASSAALAARFTPTPPPLGTKVESFSLPNAKGETVSLDSLLSSSTAVVLTYYRGSWCPYCNLALRALAKSVDEIKALGATLVALSPETPDETLTTKEKNEIPYEVLSDEGLVVAGKLGVAFTVGDDVKEIYGGFGVNLDEMNGNKGVRKAMLPAPATIVLDKEGKVIYTFADVNYSKRAEPADIIDAIKKIKA